MNPATRAHGPGPKSTPTFANGRIFTLGMTGVVLAFDAASGDVLWQAVPLPVEPQYHTAMSPVVDGDLVIVHMGGQDDGALTAFDVASGKIRWRWTGDGPAYGSPLVTTLGGVRQVVTFTQKNFVGVSVADGTLLWRRPYTTPATTTSQTPLFYKDMVIESGRANGITAFRAVPKAGEWTTANVWHTDEVSVNMSDCVAVDGVLYGLSHLNRGQYFALDLESGKVLWTGEPRRAEHAAMSPRRRHPLLARGRWRAGGDAGEPHRLRTGDALRSGDQRHLGPTRDRGRPHLREGRLVARAVDVRLAPRLRQGSGAQAPRPKTQDPRPL